MLTRKIQIYFNWLRSYNHLFEDYSLEKKLINDFEIKSMKTIHMIDAEKSESIVAQHNVIEKKISSFITDEIFDSDEEHDETITLEKENISCEHSSLITDKYREDIGAPTVANKLANMIIDFECNEKRFIPQNVQINPDPEDIYYSDDEVFQSDDEDDSELDEDEKLSDNEGFGNLTFEEDILLRRLKKITKETDDFIAANQSQDIYCKCQLSKKTCNMMAQVFELDKVKTDNIRIKSKKEEVITALRDLVNQGRSRLAILEDCRHDINNLSTLFKEVIKESKTNAEKPYEYVRRQTQTIKENAEAICVAPGEMGKW